MAVTKIKRSLRSTYNIARRTVVTVVSSPSQWKYLPEWLASYREGYLMKKQIPWLCYDAIEYVEGHVPSGARVFEYGSGASTLYWLRKGATVTSVEHDAAWYGVISQRLQGEPRLDYRLVIPNRLDDSVMTDPSDPSLFHSANPQYQRYEFSDYVTQIDSFPDGYFDIVVVDGRSRAACVRHAIPKVKPGGMLILDNAHREWYLRKTHSELTDFRLLRFQGLIPTVHVVDPTCIYIRHETFSA